MKKLRLKLYIREEKEVDSGLYFNLEALPLKKKQLMVKLKSKLYIREEEEVDSGPLGLYFNLKLSH